MKLDDLNQVIHDRLLKDNPGCFDCCTTSDRKLYDKSNQAIYRFYINTLNSIPSNFYQHWHYNPDGNKSSKEVMEQMVEEITNYEGNILLYLVTNIKLSSM